MLSQVIHGLEYTSGVHFRIEGKEIDRRSA